jgi:formamidopyrimidine-DNA glycosylase
MPELPEVETTLRGIAPHVVGKAIEAVELYRPDLRFPIPLEVKKLAGQCIRAATRRAKYILLESTFGSAIVHLGMSGSLRLVPIGTERRLHDHVDLVIATGLTLRLHDPRRFGALLWHPGSLATIAEHVALKHLGPEPLSPEFNADYLQSAFKYREAPVKNVLMDQKIVVGVGNIYAAEALFAAHVRPTRSAARVTRSETSELVLAIKRILANAIERGGTTLRDYVGADGVPGYFAQELFVYGRAGEPCRACASAIKKASLGARQSNYCPKCQV